MSEQTTAVALPEKFSIVAKKMNGSILSVIGSENLVLFEKTYQIAIAANELKEALTEEYMKPIMALQGNRLGFKTDKDTSGGYSEAVVRDCLIEAVLTGVQPFGNQFNIISGNCYITKEGFGFMLNNMPGLTYEIIPSLPRINADSTSAAIVMKISWILGGVPKEREMDIPVKMNKFMGTDAVIGKATRKARAWLFNTINGTEIGDGDVMDIQAEIMASKTRSTDPDYDRFMQHLSAAKDRTDLDKLKAQTGPELLDRVRVELDEKYNELKPEQ